MSPSNPSFPLFASVRWRIWFAWALGVLGLSAGLAWVSNQTMGLQGWISFLAMLTLSSGILFLAWSALRRERPPGWLAGLIIGAALLRLAAGVLWFVAMPVWGHDTPAENAGYAWSDAASRDQAAWNLATSQKSLRAAFQGQRKVDQYGGLLFLSAFVYRYLGGAAHQPLLLIVLTSAFSGLGVLFTWAFARRAWDAQVAGLAAWVLALYPDAVLLGSAQMREAFMITLVAVAFYGLLRFQQERTWIGMVWLLTPVLLFIPFSAPFAAFLVGALLLTYLLTALTRHSDLLKQRYTWLILVGLVIAVLLGSWVALKQFTPAGMNNPFQMLSWYVRKSAQLQAYLNRLDSGWWQKIFKSTPQWSHLPMLLVYGVVQPFLPAALVVGSHAPIHPWITLWRSVGWTVLLIFSAYAPLLAIRKRERSGFTIAVIVIVWLGILIASFRGGADMWDNPRYRTTFAGLQAGLVAWTWYEQRRSQDPWLKRILILAIAIIAWFIPWYLRRYTAFSWPIVDLFNTLGLGVLTGLLLIFLDWLYNTKLRKTEQLSNQDK